MKSRPTPSEDQFDDLLSSHFSSELDSQVGKAAERFARSAGPGPAMAGTNAPHQPNRARLQLWWTLPVIAAAAAVIMLALPIVRVFSPTLPARPDAGPLSTRIIPDNPGGQTQLAAAPGDDLRGSLTWQVRDGGMVWLDEETTARRLLKTQVQSYEWTDPTDNAKVQVTIPRNEVLLVSSPRF